uniref:(California timema) hypothetical protein n=1 Tax=Timema californicum TaxID=61474 RepID=A0A7R9P5X0_TIMCA|nr:unnamed protein product [Timema californicum]
MLLSTCPFATSVDISDSLNAGVSTKDSNSGYLALLYELKHQFVVLNPPVKMCNVQGYTEYRGGPPNFGVGVLPTTPPEVDDDAANLVTRLNLSVPPPNLEQVCHRPPSCYRRNNFVPPRLAKQGHLHARTHYIYKNGRSFYRRKYAPQRVPTALSPSNASSSSTGSQSGTHSTTISNNVGAGNSTGGSGTLGQENLSKTNLYIRGLTQNTTDRDLQVSNLSSIETCYDVQRVSYLSSIETYHDVQQVSNLSSIDDLLRCAAGEQLILYRDLLRCAAGEQLIHYRDLLRCAAAGERIILYRDCHDVQQVSNLSSIETVTMCSSYGKIISTKAILDKNTNKCKGFHSTERGVLQRSPASIISTESSRDAPHRARAHIQSHHGGKFETPGRIVPPPSPFPCSIH